MCRRVRAHARSCARALLPPSLPAPTPAPPLAGVQVWDYSVFGETQIGGTVIDLEDRLFSPQWQQMQKLGSLPKETRTLTNPGTATSQGAVVLRVEILEHKFALAHPMKELTPPVKEQFGLRLVVWEARDVAITDEDTGQSDIFITLQPRGEADYEKQVRHAHTHAHMRTTRAPHAHYMRTPCAPHAHHMLAPGSRVRTRTTTRRATRSSTGG